MRKLLFVSLVLSALLFLVEELNTQADVFARNIGIFCGGKLLTVVATGYSNDEVSINVSEWRDGLTASLTIARWGVIAVDPKIIPLGSVVWIPYFKRVFFAEDVGSQIKGHRIDVFFPSVEKAIKFGRKVLDIEVCGPLWYAQASEEEQ
jgi:3D (Asp-Asp-Asp) domain-containing protein